MTTKSHGLTFKGTQSHNHLWFNIPDNESNYFTALHLAIQSSSTECVTSLLSAGADPNLQDQLQQSPLFLAIELGHAECVQLVS